jgi:zinc transporter ZupT
MITLACTLHVIYEGFNVFDRVFAEEQMAGAALSIICG